MRNNAALFSPTSQATSIAMTPVRTSPDDLVRDILLANTPHMHTNCQYAATVAANATLAFSLGFVPGQASIPSSASMTIRDHLVPSFLSSDATTAVNEKHMAFAAVQNPLEVLGRDGLAQAIVNEINVLHRCGSYIEAADKMLDAIGSWLDAERFDYLDGLMTILAKELMSESVINDDALARIINVLSLTYSTAPVLQNRPMLRDAYRVKIEKLRGRDASMIAVAYL